MSGILDLRFAVSGGARSGWGHLVRCVELAREARARGCRVGFALDGDDAARDWLRAELPDAPAGPWHDADDLREPARWIAFDTRRDIASELAAVRAAGARALVLDRLDCVEAADRTVLPVLHAPASGHPRVRQGAAWCVVGAVVRAAAPPPYPGARDALLVAFGGADPRGLTGRVADALARALPPTAPPVHVVLGPAFRDRAALARRLADRGWRVHDAPARAELVAVMRRAQLGVCGFGTSLYDLAWLGVPALAVTHRADDVPAARRLEAAGIGHFAGDACALDPDTLAGLALGFLRDAERRRAASERGRALLGDGRGAERILDDLGLHGAECAA